MSSLIQRLKERKLFQWVFAYLAGAWLVFQALEVLAEPWNISPGTQRVAHVLLAIGFLAALVLAWYHGEKGHQRVTRTEVVLLSGLLVLAAVAVVALRADSPDAAAERPAGLAPQTLDRKSIAVLPLANLSPDPDNAYFAAGIHDDILSQLAKIRALTVISRTSVIQYAETDKDIRTIADELGVAMVLEGSVRRAGGQVRVVAQLIDAETDAHLWSETYDSELTVANVFEIQSDIAQRIAQALRAEITPDERARLAQVPTVSEDAYDYYLRGNFYYAGNPSQRENLEGAQAMYERAVALDTTFALAYAGLSRAHAGFVHQGFDRTEDRRRRARAAVDRALALEPELAEAHLALGTYYYSVFRDYEKALQALEVAARGLPGNYDLIMTQAFIAKRQGRFAEALSLLLRAAALNPRLSLPLFEMAIVYSYDQLYSEAERYYSAVLDLDAGHLAATQLALIPLWRDGDVGPLRTLAEKGQASDYDRWLADYLSGNYAAALEKLEPLQGQVSQGQVMYHPTELLAGFTHAAAGETGNARAAFNSALAQINERLRQEPGDPRLNSAAGLALAGLGRKDEAIRAGHRALELMPMSTDVLASSTYSSALITIYALLGEWDSAIEQLDRYLSEPHRYTLHGVLADPLHAPLRDHPRFPELQERHQ